jgi:hypothetical protein
MVLGWVAETRPTVTIVTDGSGGRGESRIGSSEALLRSAGATRGSCWGEISDPAFYEAVLDGNAELFVGLARRIADDLLESRPTLVAGDAREGFNPTHDVCRMMIDAAVRMVEREGMRLPNYSFLLFAPHTAASAHDAISKTLREDEFAAKVSAARAYPELVAEVEAAFLGSSRNILARHQDLAAVVDAAIAGIGADALRTERLIPTSRVKPHGETPFYEIYGERLVADGKYERAIRYREHVLPIEQALAAL